MFILSLVILLNIEKVFVHRKYCTPMPDREWEEAIEDPIDMLIKTKKCPAYVLKSKAIIGEIHFFRLCSLL
jgi:hypothetical protein